MKSRAKNRTLALEIAQVLFSSVIINVSNKKAIVLYQDRTDLVEGAFVTGTIFLDKFVDDMFGDLIENNDTSIASYKERNKKGGFHIQEFVFDDWRERGVLM